MFCAICGTSLKDAYPDRPIGYVKLLTYCPEHQRHRRKRLDKRRPLAERFWERVNKDGPVPSHMPHLGPCWLWTAGRFQNQNGEKTYGSLNRGAGNKGSCRAHVISWELHYGQVPKGLQVHHYCDNPPCVNPRHLWVGTVLENNRDRKEKGRNADQWGHRPYVSMPQEKNPAAKLTDEQVKEIRARYLAGGVTQAELGREFGISQPHVGRLVRGTRWNKRRE